MKRVKSLKQILKNTNGITLVELLVALSIISLILGPYFAHFIQSVKIGKHAEQVVHAEYVAQSVLEREKQFPKPPDGMKEKGTKSEEIDGFNVKITYEDKSPNDLATKPNLYTLEKTDATAKFFFNPKTNGVELEFVHSSNERNFPLGNNPQVGIKLEKSEEANAYNLFFQSNKSASWVSVFKITKSQNKPVTLLFDRPQILPNESLSVDLFSSASEETPFHVYVKDPNRQMAFRAKVSEAENGIVNIYRGFEDQASSGEDSSKYYWINIAVSNRSNEMLATLYSAVRKE